jgi:hypothetical protein
MQIHLIFVAGGYIQIAATTFELAVQEAKNLGYIVVSQTQT